MASLNEICRLCLEKYENFKVIDESAKNLFDIVLPKINFTEIQESVMCKGCAEVLIKCFDFKVNCLHTHNYIVLFVNEANAQLNLKDVYLSKNEIGTDVPPDEDVCGLCMDLVKNCSSVSLAVEVRGVILQKMIEQCLPELDVSIIEKPIICAPCQKSLEDCFRFVTNCLNVEEKIKKYCETLDINSKGQKELNSSQITVRDVTTSKIDGHLVGIIKMEDQLCENEKNPYKREIGAGDVIKLEQTCLDGNEGANENVENQNCSFLEFDDGKVEDEQQFTPNNTWSYEEESNKLGFIKIEETFCGENKTELTEKNLVEGEDQKFLVNEDIKIKTDQHDLDRIAVRDVTTSKIDGQSFGIIKEEDQFCENGKNLYKRKIDIGDDVINLEQKFLDTEGANRDVENGRFMEFDDEKVNDEQQFTLNKMYTYGEESNKLGSIKIDEIFCGENKIKLNEGSLVEMEDQKFFVNEEIEIKTDQHDFNRFENVSYLPVSIMLHGSEKRLKSNLERDPSKPYIEHALIKKKIVQFSLKIPMYKCNSCSFQTKDEGYLKNHLLNHKNRSEENMYRCDYCSFHTVHEDIFECHLLVHRNPSRVTMYKCASCSFRTKHKDGLRKHLLIHKDSS